MDNTNYTSIKVKDNITEEAKTNLMESYAQLEMEKTEYLENRKRTISNLEKEVQGIFKEIKGLKKKQDKLKEKFDSFNKLKDDFENELKIEQGIYETVLQKIKTGKLDTDKRIEEFKSTYNAQRDKITHLQKMLKNLDKRRKTQEIWIEDIKSACKCLAQRSIFLDKKMRNRKNELLQSKKMLDDQHSQLSKNSDGDEKH